MAYGGRVSCRWRCDFGRITTRRTCARWPRRRAMQTRPGVCWHWRRSMREVRAAKRPGSAASGSSPSTSSGGRDWGLAVNAGGPGGLIDGKAPGKVPLLNAEQRAALQRIIEAGPNPAVDGVVRWRLIDLAQWVYAEFRISISKQTLSRILRRLGARKLSALHRNPAQDPAALEALKKTAPGVWRRSRTMRPQASRSRCGFATGRDS